ncbi:GSU2403 family nucleotidyltransferase fold protein [Paracoccus litorisediminis]|uniref:GSU2403 family nucleotidyltransferase fold protein n=1 Tax=Paracoccus litorisediminis TaxID=2006130 RepID=UPI003730AF85
MSLPLQVQTAYQDLLQRYLVKPDLDFDGSIMRIEKGDKAYWISRKRMGNSAKDTAIGPDNEDTRAMVDKALEQQETHKSWNREVSANVAMLKAARCLAPDLLTGKLLAGLSHTGFFKAGGVIGGTQAFRHYPLDLGLETPSLGNIQTGDLDLVAPGHLRLAGLHESFMTRVGRFVDDLKPQFPLDQRDPMKWVVDGRVEIEILSPVVRGGEPSYDHPGLGEKVQTLRYLEYALKDPIQAVSLYRGGVLIAIPSPQRYACHKLLVAQCRQGAFQQKKRKDLDQAEWLIEHLAKERPYDLWAAWSDLTGRGRKWRGLAEDSLRERPGIRDHLDAVMEEFGDAPGLSDTESGSDDDESFEP